MRKVTLFREGQTFEYELVDEAAVIAFGKELVATLPGGAVLGLNGDLGAGKTTFAKGVAEGLGVAETITSPTFVIMKTYPATGREGVKTFCHIDAYRLKSGADLDAVGAQDFIGKSDVITLVEWPGNVIDALPADMVMMMFDIPPTETE